MENLKIEGVICAPSSSHRRYENRPSHALVFKNRGQTRYTFDHGTMLLGAGELLFLPKGCCYTVEALGAPGYEYSLINFQAEIEDPKPMLFSVSDKVNTDQICAQLRALQVISSQADRYRLQSLFYMLLSCICDVQSSAHPRDQQLRRLSPALDYLKQHTFSTDLRIGQLHRLCDMSDTYFRELFVSAFGMTPKKFVLHRRLEFAKTLLENGEYDSIAQAAALSGFDDPLYFSKVFKKQFGCAPSAYIQDS